MHYNNNVLNLYFTEKLNQICWTFLITLRTFELTNFPPSNQRHQKHICDSNIFPINGEENRTFFIYFCNKKVFVSIYRTALHCTKFNLRSYVPTRAPYSSLPSFRFLNASLEHVSVVQWTQIARFELVQNRWSGTFFTDLFSFQKILKRPRKSHRK